MKIRHGATTTWYENGQMRSKKDFLVGQRHGKLLVYYPATSRRRDHSVRGIRSVARKKFVDDKRTTGTCFEPDGKPAPYFDYK